MRDKAGTLPSPWVAEGRSIVGMKGQKVGEMNLTEDARRVVSCVNACARIPSSLLERNVIWRLIDKHAETLEQEIPELKELLRDGPYH